VCRII